MNCYFMIEDYYCHNIELKWLLEFIHATFYDLLQTRIDYDTQENLM